MYVEDKDYFYRDKAVDILGDLEMLKQDLLIEIEERENSGDFNASFLHKLLSDTDLAILSFKKYKENFRDN